MIINDDFDIIYINYNIIVGIINISNYIITAIYKFIIYIIPIIYNIIYDIIYDFSYLYDYIEYLGINYGFLHNDLHFNNILIDKRTKKLTIIDFGRSSFGYFYNNTNQQLNKFILMNLNELNLKDFLFSNFSKCFLRYSSS